MKKALAPLSFLLLTALSSCSIHIGGDKRKSSSPLADDSLSKESSSSQGGQEQSVPSIGPSGDPDSSYSGGSSHSGGQSSGEENSSSSSKESNSSSSSANPAPSQGGSSSASSTQSSSSQENSSTSSSQQSESSSSTTSASSSASKGDASSSYSSSYSGASSSMEEIKEAEYYRYVPTVSTGDSANVYNVQFEKGKGYVATLARVIDKDTAVYTYEEVAEYYMNFRTLPPNYGSKSSGSVDRRAKSYYRKEGRSNDYTVPLGTFNEPIGGEYIEFDIGEKNGSYSFSRRGAYRLVVVVDGINEDGYGSEPVCYMTSDHYADFREYYGYNGGWSPLFAGIKNSSGSYTNTPVTDQTRVHPETIIPAF